MVSKLYIHWQNERILIIDRASNELLEFSQKHLDACKLK